MIDRAGAQYPTSRQPRSNPSWGGGEVARMKGSQHCWTVRGARDPIRFNEDCVARDVTFVPCARIIIAPNMDHPVYGDRA